MSIEMHVGRLDPGSEYWVDFFRVIQVICDLQIEELVWIWTNELGTVIKFECEPENNKIFAHTIMGLAERRQIWEDICLLGYDTEGVPRHYHD